MAKEKMSKEEYELYLIKKYEVFLKKEDEPVVEEKGRSAKNRGAPAVVDLNNVVQNVEARHRYYCCCSLEAGASYSACFGIVVSVATLLASLEIFFRAHGSDEGASKLIAACSAVLAAYYIKTCRSLKHGIKDKTRWRFVPWICLTVLTGIYLLAGATYKLFSYWDLLLDFKADEFQCWFASIFVFVLVFSGFTLLYCSFGVVLLYESMTPSSREDNRSQGAARTQGVSTTPGASV